MWDYRDRMLSAWVSGATSTYQYDHTIAGMRQVLASSTTDYPNRFYSLATSTQSGTGTSTAHIWHGDTLVATIEQRLVNGVASGTATTYYVHPDHLGSTNAITNSAGVVKQALDYYPYGAQRINTGMDASDRRFIGQFADDATSLDYLMALYYDGSRGQFLSEDPSFLALGNRNYFETAHPTRAASIPLAPLKRQFDHELRSLAKTISANHRVRLLSQRHGKPHAQTPTLADLEVRRQTEPAVSNADACGSAVSAR
jgi:RHS repeat-associated protein